MNFIHFYIKDSPQQVLIAVKHDNKYYCQVPYLEKDSTINTTEFVFDETTLSSRVKTGNWKLVKINNFSIKDLI